MRNAETILGINVKVTGEPLDIERVMSGSERGRWKSAKRVTRWRPTLLHEQFLGGWAGAILPGYPALGRRAVR